MLDSIRDENSKSFLKRNFETDSGWRLPGQLCRFFDFLDQVAQLQPWLVPHSVQTPQAPARMTLSLPHTEQVIPMKMLPSATMTRSSWPLPFPLCPAAPGSFDERLVITSRTCLSAVWAKSVTGRFTAFFSISPISFSGRSGWARLGDVASL